MKNKIHSFMHCKECVAENDIKTQSHQDYQRISVGWTDKGFQVWCNRHDLNIMAFDFMGQKIQYDEEDE